MPGFTKPIIPTSSLAVQDEGGRATIPWYQFFDQVVNLSIEGTFPTARAFAFSQQTSELGIGSLFIYTGIDGATLALDDNMLLLGTPNQPFVFSVKDQGGNAGTNNLIISGSAMIDGAAVLTIGTDYGSARLYTDGTAFYSL